MEIVYPPCKDCQDRHELCHGECEKYKKYDEYRKAYREWLMYEKYRKPWKKTPIKFLTHR